MARTKLPHGDGSLFFRKDRGLWIGRVELGYLPDGTRDRKEVSGKTKTEVLEKMKKARSKKDAGLIQTPARLTVAAHLEAWIAATELSGTVKPSTVETYRGVITRQLTPTLGRIQLDKLQPAHVEKMLSDMRRTLSPATCGLAHATLRRALSEAVRKGYLMRNVASLVRGPRVVNTKPTEVLSPSEAAALLAGAEGTWLEVFVLLGLMLALRPGESLALRWEDVSFDTGMLSVNGTLGRLRGQGMVRTAPKNEHSRRNLPMPETLVAALRAQRVRQLEEKMANRARWTDSGYVLTNSFGRPLDTKHLSVSFRRLVTHTLGAESTVRSHGLRHSAATFALTGGAPLKYVSDLLGHSSIAVTSAVYIHLKPEHMVDTALLLERTVLEARKATGTDGVGTVAR